MPEQQYHLQPQSKKEAALFKFVLAKQHNTGVGTLCLRQDVINHRAAASCIEPQYELHCTADGLGATQRSMTLQRERQKPPG